MTRESVQRAREPGRGRQAETPMQIPARGWKDILARLYARFSESRATLIAAGTTFYLLLALFPTLAALVSIYGFLADRATLTDHLSFLAGIMPAEGFAIIRDQIVALVAQDQATLGFTFFVSLAVTLWSANNGVKTMFEAMNVAYGETEKRGFIKLTLITLGFTLGALLLAVLFIFVVAAVPVILAAFPLGGFAETLVSVVRWPILGAAAIFALAALYRYGPSRDKAEWRWLSLGAIVTVIVWLAASLLFSWYLANFADYNKTYGSLGAVVGLMMWTWVSVLILIVGAELNAEMEHQTAKDTTTGPDKPLGERGALMADTVGRSTDEGAGKKSELAEREDSQSGAEDPRGKQTVDQALKGAARH